jgi:ABC-type bacteriocin/lantibiotic exporter with double-glycine peptidase domain
LFNHARDFVSFRVPSELRWLAQRIRPFVRWHLASFFCITAGSLLALLTPLVLKWMIDQVLPRRETGLLLGAAVLIFASYQGRTALTSAGNYLTLNAVQKMAFRMRIELLRHLDKLSANYYESTPPGSVMYPFKEPVDEVAYFGSDLLPAILRMGLTTGFTVVTMFVLSPVLTLAILPLVPMFLVVRQRFRTKLFARSDDVQRDLVAWSSFLEEHLSSILPIQLLGQERHQERIAFQLLARTTRSYLALFKTGIWFTVYTSLAVVLAMSAVIGYGGWSVIAGTLSLGSMVAFYSFVTQLFDPLSGATELYARAQNAFASIRQLQSILALRPTITDSPGCVHFPEKAWGLEFTGVEFAYAQQERALRIPSLEIDGGEEAAIVGENGAGKSTLARLIARVFDVNAGSIRVDGVDIRDIQLKSLRTNVCYLPRDPVLFDGTVASNLRFVRPAASDEELDEVIQLADLASVVAALPGGIHQRIGPDACQLSGGERQRLAIARALLQRPCILILDEATSCLDPASESLILHNLRKHLPTSTLVVVSHRPSTLTAFRRILVLAGGRIAEDLETNSLVSWQADWPRHFSSISSTTGPMSAPGVSQSAPASSERLSP